MAFSNQVPAAPPGVYVWLVNKKVDKEIIYGNKSGIQN
jgi:hypothetical protein